MNLNKIQIDFIIPIYNTSRDKLAKCIESVLSVKNIESKILLIDDGSDKVDEKSICDHFVQSNPDKVFYFYKNNGGVSSARNYGLKKSKSDYICFVDSDDLVLKLNTNFPSKSEIVIYNLFFEENSKFKRFNLHMSSGNILATKYFKILLKNSIWNSVCGKLFQRKFLQQNKILFNEKIIHGEDLNFLLQCLSKDPLCYYIDSDMYLYKFDKQSENNRFNSTSMRVFNDYIINFDLKYKFISQNYDLEHVKFMLLFLYNDMLKSLFNLYLSNIVHNKNIDQVNRLRQNIISYIDDEKFDNLTLLNKIRYMIISFKNHFFAKFVGRVQQVYKRVK